MPIKRNEHIVQLSREHHHSLLFVWKIRQGISKNVEIKRIKNYIEYFTQHHLFPHFDDEENILFVLAAQNSGVQKAIDDHQKIRLLLQSVAQTDDGDTNASDLLMQLAQCLDDHVRYEERTLFPELETLLTPSQLESVGHILNHDLESKPTDDY